MGYGIYYWVSNNSKFGRHSKQPENSIHVSFSNFIIGIFHWQICKYNFNK